MTLQEYFSSPEKWTQGSLYRNDKDEPVEEKDSQKACLLGAAYVCYGFSINNHVLDKILKEIPNGLITAWNDAPERTFADICALVERLGV